MIAVRAFEPEEWALLKRTRLAALSDAPHAFSSTLAKEEVLPDEHWAALAGETGRFAGNRSFLAARGDAVVAMAGCFPETPVRFRLVAMWVCPQARGEKVGASLLGAVETWARARGGTELMAAVFNSNRPAITFYRKHGFEPVVPDPPSHAETDRFEIQLSKPLRDTLPA